MTQLQNNAGYLIRRAHQTSVAMFMAQTRAAGLDLTPVQYGVLATLIDRPGIDQATVAGLIGHDRATIGGVVFRLETRGYIERKVREDDRRARRLTLTPLGEAVCLAMAPVVRAAENQIFAGLDEQEREIFMRTVRKLAEAGNGLGRYPHGCAEAKAE